LLGAIFNLPEEADVFLRNFIRISKCVPVAPNGKLISEWGIGEDVERRRCVSIDVRIIPEFAWRD
jgi:hypothetical protein